MNVWINMRDLREERSTRQKQYTGQQKTKRHFLKALMKKQRLHHKENDNTKDSEKKNERKGKKAEEEIRGRKEAQESLKSKTFQERGYKKIILPRE